jgi:hypothetical protein
MNELQTFSNLNLGEKLINMLRSSSPPHHPCIPHLCDIPFIQKTVSSPKVLPPLDKKSGSSENGLINFV